MRKTPLSVARFVTVDGKQVFDFNRVISWACSRVQREQAYERFVLDGVSEDHNEEYYALADQRFLGEEGGIEYSYMVLFSIDGDGVWRIKFF